MAEVYEAKMVRIGSERHKRRRSRIILYNLGRSWDQNAGSSSKRSLITPRQPLYEHPTQMCWWLPSEIHVSFLTANFTLNPAIKEIIHLDSLITVLSIKLGSVLCRKLPAFHAFNRSDYTPDYSYKGKIRPLNILGKIIKLCFVFEGLLELWSYVPDDSYYMLSWVFFQWV